MIFLSNLSKMRFTIGHFTIPIVAFFFFFFTYSKMFFFFPRKKIKIRFKKERFTIGIVKLPIVKRSVTKIKLFVLNKIFHFN
jgi:hypothetical protein